MKQHIRFRRLFVEPLELRQLFSADMSFEQGDFLAQSLNHDHLQRHSSFISTDRPWRTPEGNSGEGRAVRPDGPAGPRHFVDREFNGRVRSWESAGFVKASPSYSQGFDNSLRKDFDRHSTAGRQRAPRYELDHAVSGESASSSTIASRPLSHDQVTVPLSLPFNDAGRIAAQPQSVIPAVASIRSSIPTETISFPVTSLRSNITTNAAFSTSKVSATGSAQAISIGSVEATLTTTSPMSLRRESTTEESQGNHSLPTSAKEGPSVGELGWTIQFTNSQSKSSSLIELNQASSTHTYPDWLIELPNLKLDLLTQTEGEAALKPWKLAGATLKNLRKTADRQAGVQLLQQIDAAMHDLTVVNWTNSESGLIELVGCRLPICHPHLTTNSTRVVVQLDSIMGWYRSVEMILAGAGNELEIEANNSIVISTDSTEFVLEGRGEDELLGSIGTQIEAVTKVEQVRRILLNSSLFLTTLLTYISFRRQKKRDHSVPSPTTKSPKVGGNCLTPSLSRYGE